MVESPPAFGAGHGSQRGGCRRGGKGLRVRVGGAAAERAERERPGSGSSLHVDPHPTSRTGRSLHPLVAPGKGPEAIASSHGHPGSVQSHSRAGVEQLRLRAIDPGRDSVPTPGRHRRFRVGDHRRRPYGLDRRPARRRDSGRCRRSRRVLPSGAEFAATGGVGPGPIGSPPRGSRPRMGGCRTGCSPRSERTEWSVGQHPHRVDKYGGGGGRPTDDGRRRPHQPGSGGLRPSPARPSHHSSGSGWSPSSRAT